MTLNPPAYAFDAETFCAPCVWDMFFDTTTMDPCGTDTEDVLDRAALLAGFDRHTRPHDSKAFPVPIRGLGALGAVCGRCREKVSDVCDAVASRF